MATLLPKQQYRSTIHIGDVFSRLTVLEYVGVYSNKNIWKCQCSCSKIKLFDTSGLLSGDNKSCGCLHRENTVARNKATATHRLSRTPLYSIYGGMISRCHNPKDKSFPRYGGVGIYVCDAWRRSSKVFFDYIGPRPTPQHSLDRIDSLGPYAPGNVRWATKKEQAENRSSTVFIEFQGQRKTIAEWARTVGLEDCTLRRRLRVHKWSVERALTEPPRKWGAYANS